MHEHVDIPEREEIEKAVSKGVALLDRYGPADWRALVRGGGKLNHIEMGKVDGIIGECGCIISRVTGNYAKGLSKLYNAAHIGEFASGTEYGFSVYGSDREAWMLLADIWNEVLWPSKST